jgi:Zn-dependent protease with chaperone function
MVTIVVGALLSALFFAIVRRSPRRYWLWFWAASLPLMAAAVFLAPLVLDPMFNRFEPLAKTHPELVEPIERILHKTGVTVPRDRLFEMIASDKTNALNAYVTGFGASNRVVLYDTIIRKEPLAELMTTFAHELGHYALHHVLTGLLFSAALLFLLMWAGYRIVAAVLRRRSMRDAVRGPGDLAALPLFLLFAVAASFLCDPIVNAFSRHQEHAADVFSLEATNGVIPDPGAAAARAFQMEGETDLELPDPNPAVVYWMYTHPPVVERLRFALRWRETRTQAGSPRLAG